MIIDSNIIIYLASGKADLPHIFQAERLSTSIICQLEVYSFTKLSAAAESSLDTVFAGFDYIHPVDDVVVRKAIELRRIRKKPFADILIAATALAHNEELLTNNVKDFAWVDGLVVSNPLD